jgi:hypothetical protein
MIEFQPVLEESWIRSLLRYVVKGEHNIGVIARTGPGTLTVYQLATLRDQQPTATDRKRVRTLAGLE